VQRTENWSTGIGLVLIRQRRQSCENLSNSSYPSKFIRNATKNSVNPQEVPLGYNMSWGRVRVSRNIIIRMSLSFWVKGYLKSSPQSHCQRRTLVFRIKVGIKVDHVCLRLNSLGIGRTILMLSSKVHLAQSCQQERKLVMETIKTVQSRIIYRKSAP